ncbi:MAG: branched-chain amino acid ABC transporter permease [Thermodesulfobacteriota bacterium]|jgi:branched-chain amino acid transport system permease protein
MIIAQLILEGLATGACYGLLGIAVVIIYKTSEVVNFGQGEMGMFSSFIIYHLLVNYNVPFFQALLITLALSFFMGILIEFLFLKPVKNAHLLDTIVLTLGADMLILGLASWKWSYEQKQLNIPWSYEKIHDFQGIVISDWAIAIITTSIVSMVFLYLFFKYTKFGIAMRATQQNKFATKLMGANVERVFSAAWAFSSVIGALAAMFFITRSTLDPACMMEPFLKTFAAAVLGGLMSIPGVFIGGLMLGVIENLFGFVWPAWKPIVAFVVIVIVLCLRPSGLFAKHYIRKV